MNGSRQPAVVVSDVTKRYPKTRPWREMLRFPSRREHVEALRGVSLEIPAGRVHGLLGANGAGKTSLLKVLATLVAPTTGRARVAGFDVAAEAAAARRRLGFVTAEERSFYWRLSGRENLLFFAALHDLPRPEVARRVDRLLADVGLGDDGRRAFREYSSGMKQKLAIARGLLGDPEVVLMDEPTRSLDPPASAWVQQFIRERLAGERGTSVLLATHDLLEAASTCDALTLIDDGRVVAEGSVEELSRPMGRAARTVVTLLDPSEQVLDGLTRADAPTLQGDRIPTVDVLAPGEPELLAAFVREAVGRGAHVIAVKPEETSLSALFERVAAARGSEP